MHGALRSIRRGTGLWRALPVGVRAARANGAAPFALLTVALALLRGAFAAT